MYTGTEISIKTKYIITADKTVLSSTEVPIYLKKGDIIQGVSIITNGDNSNDSGSKYLVFTDKKGNRLTEHIGYRGFVPFFKEYVEEKATETNVVAETFYQKHKNHLLIALALVAGYYAYKKLNK